MPTTTHEVLDSIRFENQVVVVTGAGNGLGRGHALEIARRGGAVVVNDNGRDPEGQWFADLVVGEIHRQGGNAIASHDSVADPKSAVNIADTALDTYGRIDALINNAGNNHWSSFEDTDIELFEDMFSVHVRGHYLLTQRAYGDMARRGYGRIVFVSSAGGLFGRRYAVAYATAKCAVIGMMNIIALEGESKGILANALLPSCRGTAIHDRTQQRGDAPVPNTDVREDDTPRVRCSFVVPLAAYLASRQCTSTHGIYSAQLGRYTRVFVAPGQGWLAEGGLERDTPPTVEDIAAHWDQICDPSELVEFPGPGSGEQEFVMRRLRASG